MKIAFLLALKNLYRKRERSFLTIIGVLLAVGSFISLLSLAEGLYYRFDREIRGRRVDIYVMPSDGAALPTGPLGTVGITSEILPEGLQLKIANFRGITHVCPVQRVQEKMGDRTIIIWGMEKDKFVHFFPFFQLKPGGRLFNEGEREIVVGGSLAAKHGIEPGSVMNVQGRQFNVVGVSEPVGTLQDYFCYIPLDRVMADRQLSGYQEIWIQLAVSNYKTRLDAVRELRNLYPRYLFNTQEEYLGAAREYVYYAWLLQFAISAIGILIATTAAMNTMLMSTYERIKEFGTLRSIGASRLTVFQMILFESVILTILGGLGGVILGIMGSRILDEVIRAMFQLSFPLARITFNLILYSFILSGVIGIIGAIIPAIIVYRMEIIDALRWE